MMNTKRKQPRTGPSRPQRGRSATSEGIYSNPIFVHAVTSNVGNIVQVQTQSGSVFEGIFRTFSTKFEVVLEMAHKVDNLNDDRSISVSSVTDVIIFKPNDIVSIAARDVDWDYASRDTFQTDTAISRCNGSLRQEEKELEPWDASAGGVVNGEFDCTLSDNNSNGWDANDMFNKNETMYGVQSTFDQSLAGYTIPLQKRDTQDFKDAEEQAEKIALEIENQPTYKERVELENGDEESRYAAVERPSTNNSPHGGKEDNQNCEKYVPPARRKNLQTGKLLRNTSTALPINNNHPAPSQSPQAAPPPKTNYPSMPMQIQSQHTEFSKLPPPPYVQQVLIHNDYSQPPPNMPVGTTILNGSENNNSNSNVSVLNKAQRRFIPTANTPVAFTEPPPQLGQKQMGMGKPPIHTQHAQQVVPHLPAADASQQSHVIVSTTHIVHQPQSIAPPLAPLQQAPSQPIRHRMQSRDEQIKDLRKFKNQFILAPSHQQQPHQPQHQMQNPSTHQQPQPTMSPPQQSPIDTLPPLVKHQQHHPSMQQQQREQQQHQQQQQEKLNYSAESQPQNYTNVMQHTQSHNQPPSMNIQSPGLQQSTSPPQTQQRQPTPPQQQSLNDSEKSTATKSTLNPKAKPFTPRNPSTPNPSRPHTPQTPQQNMQQGSYQQPQQQPHINQYAQPQMMLPTYLMQPTAPFQAPQHPHSGPLPRFKRIQMQVNAAAATGQPLTQLIPPTQIQQFVPFPQTHPQQGYPHVVYKQIRMYESGQQQQVQYMTPTPPSTTPSPGQPHQQHQQFHLGPQPSPAGGGPPYAQAQATTQQPQFQMMCPMITTPLQPYYPGSQMQNHPQQQYTVLMSQHNPAQ